ncbi:MAG: hypothetical protein Fur0041_16010 [Bacteroidia bacterium]
MKKLYIITSLFIIGMASCTTFDNAEIYHKNFSPGTHPLLRFDGYYSDTLRKKNNVSGNLSTMEVKPVYFYDNGSAFSYNNYSQAGLINSSVQDKSIGSWGNYLIKGDTLLLEKFVFNPNSGNHERIIMKGAIQEGRIIWVARKEHNESFKPVNYSMVFFPNASKPDVSGNWIRTKKKYNK